MFRNQTMPLNNDSLTNIDNNSQLVGSSASIDESMPKNSSPVNFSYEKMDNPYNTEASRSVTPFFGKNYKQDEGEAVIKTGDSITDIWVNTWIKSKNYLPAKRGFILDAKKGSIECEKLFASDVIIRMIGTGPGFDTTGIEFNDGSFSGNNVVKINKNGIILRPGKGINFQGVNGNFSGLFATEDLFNPSRLDSDLHWFLTPSNRFFMYRYGSGTYEAVASDTLFTVSDTQIYAGRLLYVADASAPSAAGHIVVEDGTGSNFGDVTVNGKVFRAVKGAFDANKYYLREI